MRNVCVRMATEGDLAEVAAIGAQCQGDPKQFCVYLGDDAQSIAAEIGEVPNWTDNTAVACVGDEVVGWLLIEGDSDMGRLWWWGPFVTVGDWDLVADALTNALAVQHEGFREWEACGGEANVALERWANRHGMEAEIASAVLTMPATARASLAGHSDSVRVRPVEPRDHREVEALHAEAFAGSHLTPSGLVKSKDHTIDVAEDAGGDVVGYLAAERHPDRSGYIDFVAVDPTRRGNGIGAALVSHCAETLFANGAPAVNLTVAANNEPARRLYARLGFIETCVAVPYRKGFSLRPQT